MDTRKSPFQIIATLGPAVEQSVPELLSAGATGFRLNCSHLSLDMLLYWLAKLEPILRHHNDVLVFLDLQGSKMRIGELTVNRFLHCGERVIFSPGHRQVGKEIPLPHPEIFNLIKPGALIQLDDGRIELVVLENSPATFVAEVRIAGNLTSYKGFVLQKVAPFLTQISLRDLEIIQETICWPFIGYAISYLQHAIELKLYKNQIGDHPIVAKIERTQVFDSLFEIAELADSTWLCRGDLGVDASIYELFQYEKAFISRMKQQNKPYLIAGQVLENMVNRNYPSRSEITHLSYLLENGFTGVILSDETAIGKFPLEAVRFCRDFLDYFGKRLELNS